MSLCYSLLYRSHATRQMSSADLRELLVKARARNFLNGVTGHLHYESGMFFQYLEGTREKVDHIMGFILPDPLHVDLEVTYTNPTGPRRFGGFAMSWSRKDSGSLLEALEERGSEKSVSATIAFLERARSMALPG